ncbi:UrcA family protein [Gluconobacter wancherniae]|uniref:UrcA family protein n=1 Tax=Gluconobacter wancherniae TaxID=1307955 RepID=UPI001B8B4B27|nr:UrcA family protein [Gluconobacter wancherniae]MBS1094774.1 UrcA family protein [Gluconobacter wancherniae]
MIRLSILSAALLAVFAVPSNNARASITPFANTLSSTVKLDGLDLTRDTDWNEAKQRVQKAAESVCSSLTQNSDALSSAFTECQEDSEANARHDLAKLRRLARVQQEAQQTRIASVTTPHA